MPRYSVIAAKTTRVQMDVDAENEDAAKDEAVKRLSDNGRHKYSVESVMTLEESIRRESKG